MEEDRSFADLEAAYSAAWTIRTEQLDASYEVLRGQLFRHGLGDLFGPDRPGEAMIRPIWERGVPPEELSHTLRREIPRIAGGALRAAGRAYWELARLFANTKWEKADLAWMDLPQGHRKLSDDRKAYDLLLRHFHKPVEQIELEVTLHDNSSALGKRFRSPSANRRDAFELSAWVRLGGHAPDADVMVGSHQVGRVVLPPPVWDDLHVEEARGVHADGRLFFPMSGELVATLQSFVPKTRR